MKATLLNLVLYALIALTSTPSFAQIEIIEKKIVANDGDSGDLFGRVVDLSSDIIAVGTSKHNTSPNNYGAVYLYERNNGGIDNWGQSKEISVLDSAWGNRFAASLSIHGNTLVVGSYWDDDNGIDSGAVYVFDRDEGGLNNWGQVIKLLTSDGFAGDLFGYSLSLDGNTLVVGARSDGDACNQVPNCASGSAYIFEKNYGGIDNWGEVKKLTASDSAANDSFGFSVSISGDTVVIGAYKNGDACQSTLNCFSGSAYVFERNFGGSSNWGEVVKLTASNAAAADFFGESVAISIDAIVIGAWGHSYDSGAAYIYNRNHNGVNNWGEVKILTASDSTNGDQFGNIVAISADQIIVGSPLNNGSGVESGTAYVFNRNYGGLENWGESKKYVGIDTGTYSHFAKTVAIDNENIVIGDRADDENGINAGAAYVINSFGNLESTSRWSFNENAGCIANDSKGSSNGILGPDCPQNNAPDWAPGKIGSALDFSTASDLVEIPSDNLQSDTFTITAWVKADTLRNYRTVFMNSTSGSWSDGFGLFYSTVNGLTFFVNNINNKVSAPISLGVWTHYSVSYDGAELAIYVNGNLVQVFPYSQPINYPNPITAPFQIGKGAGGVTSYGWSGSIDEVNYFDRALSGTEILDIFNQDILPSETSVNLSFDDNSGCIAFDELGTHDGSLGPSCNSGNGPNWVPGKINSALDFDGIDDVVEIAMDSDLQSNHITVAACIKPETLGNWDTVIMNASSNSWADGYGIYYLPTTGINFYVNQYSTYKVSAPISTGVWTHVAATYDLVEMKLYINGVLADTLPYSQFISYPNPFTPLVIGKGPGGATANAWDGAIDQVYVSGNAKSDTEIYNIYLEQCSELIFKGSFE